MKTIEEVRDWLIKNRVDEKGDLDLSDLDFSKFEGNIYEDGWKVKNNLYRHNTTVGKDLQNYERKRLNKIKRWAKDEKEP